MNAFAELEEKFAAHFGSYDQRAARFFAPGRVNLIGEYTDFNGGYVFPAAVSYGIWGLLRPNPGRVVRLRSTNDELAVDVSLDEPVSWRREDGWANYPKGIIRDLLAKGLALQGCDILYSGNLPAGAGLSSSAAMLVLTAYMLRTCFESRVIDLVTLAQTCRQVENEFIGVNCGIMDHFIIAKGRPDRALLLDCNTLEHDYIPFDLGKYRLVIMNTNKKRELTESKYNERRQQCDAAVAILSQHRPLQNLCQATLAEVETLLSDPVLRKRARHVVSENQRVLEAVAALQAGNTAAFGRLMAASHCSLRDDFAVSGPELDALVEHAWAAPGCIGARMTGAGFGGCAIALVDHQDLQAFMQQVQTGYQAVTGRSADFYPAIIAGGVKSEEAAYGS